MSSTPTTIECTDNRPHNLQLRWPKINVPEPEHAPLSMFLAAVSSMYTRGMGFHLRRYPGLDRTVAARRTPDALARG